MKKFSFFAVLFSVLLSISCASGSKGKVTKCEPKDNESVLLCGILTAEGIGLGSYMGEVSVNGLHTKGIELQLKDLNTNKIIKVKTEKNGFYYYPKAIAGHRYQLVDATVKDEKGSYSTWITFDLYQMKPTLCKRRQASVMSNVRLTYKPDSSWNWYDSGDAERVRTIFKNIYTDSNWSNYDFYYSRY
ncbi:MAG: hypothetical protein MJ181_04430 [Treponema sp.]|nr:hypothetical protein [Treponema sp.]